MGRGDQRTKKGKVSRGTFGKSRPKHGGKKGTPAPRKPRRRRTTG